MEINTRRENASMNKMKFMKFFCPRNKKFAISQWKTPISVNSLNWQTPTAIGVHFTIFGMDPPLVHPFQNVP